MVSKTHLVTGHRLRTWRRLRIRHRGIGLRLRSCSWHRGIGHQLRRRRRRLLQQTVRAHSNMLLAGLRAPPGTARHFARSLLPLPSSVPASALPSLPPIRSPRHSTSPANGKLLCEEPPAVSLINGMWPHATPDHFVGPVTTVNCSGGRKNLPLGVIGQPNPLETAGGSRPAEPPGATSFAGGGAAASFAGGGAAVDAGFAGDCAAPGCGFGVFLGGLGYSVGYNFGPLPRCFCFSPTNDGLGANQGDPTTRTHSVQGSGNPGNTNLRTHAQATRKIARPV